MRIVDRTSHPLAAARATLQRTADDVTAARSTYFPQLDLTGSYLRTLRSEFTGLFPTVTSATDAVTREVLNVFSAIPFGREHTWNGDIIGRQQIWDGGKTASTVALARSSELAAALDVRSRRAQAVLAVTDAYYGALLAARVVAIGESSLALAEQTLEFTRLGYQRGTSAEFDVIRSEVTRDTQRTTLIRSRADRDQAFLRLRHLLGIPFERPLELVAVTSDAAQISALARVTAGVHDGERIAVGQARANLDTRRAELGIARSARSPTIHVIGDYGRVNYPTHFLPTGDWRTNFTVAVNVEFPLFTGFRISAQIRGARADQRAAEQLLLEAQELSAVDEARAISDAEVADATFAASHRTTELAQRAYEIADVRYRQGLATYTDLDNARIQFDQAQIDEASAGRDVAVTSVRLALLPALPLGNDNDQRAIAPSAIPNLVVTPQAAAPARTSPLR